METENIKFRAFWKGVNEMRHFDSPRLDYIGEAFKGNWGMFLPVKEGSIFMGSCTVMPFIGIKDNNGKDIYEGDIILSQEFFDRPHSAKRETKRFYGIVKQDTGGKFPVQYSAGWGVEFKNRGNFGHGVLDDFHDCEVVGNIYQNPELLEKNEPINKEK